MKIHVAKLLIHLMKGKSLTQTHNDSKSFIFTMINEVALVARAFTKWLGVFVTKGPKWKRDTIGFWLGCSGGSRDGFIIAQEKFNLW